MSVFRRGEFYWYEFWFAGRRVRESSKSASKTVAQKAEKKRLRELEEGFNNVVTDARRDRIRLFREVADTYLEGYRLRLPQSAIFADYAVAHLNRILGGTMLVDFNESTVIAYQNKRLDERAAPKTIYEEVGFLLRILDEQGDLLRLRLRKKKMLKLKVRRTVGKAFSQVEKDRMLDEASKARSPHIYPALVLALNAGMRDAEIKNLMWGQIDFEKQYLAVGRSKTDAGEGRTIPLNSTLFEVFREYAVWYKDKFGKPQPEWYVFPFGKPNPSDPTRPVTTLKTAWNNVRIKAEVKGRWHDNRHTLITDLAESGAGDQTIMDIAGHVSKQMLKHYSHIRMEAKRTALEAIVKKKPTQKAKDKEAKKAATSARNPSRELQNWGNGHGRKNVARKTQKIVEAESGQNSNQQCSLTITNTQGFDLRSPQKSPHSGVFEGHRGVGKGSKSLKINGSSGRTRTYNPSVNSRMLCH